MIPLLAAFFFVAALYAAVGHGGASGYLAVMALSGFAPEVLRPTALTLNLCVSLVGTVLFFRAGKFRARLFVPLVAASIPFACLGGMVHLPGEWFHALLAGTLGFAALRLVLPLSGEAELCAPRTAVLLALGAVIGLLSGLVGVGGGIFLTPLLVLLRWSDVRTAAALSAPFIFLNSAAGLLGQFRLPVAFPDSLPWLIVVVLTGGSLGALWGSGQARLPHLRLVLAAVLAMACVKLIVI